MKQLKPGGRVFFIFNPSVIFLIGWTVIVQPAAAECPHDSIALPDNAIAPTGGIIASVDNDIAWPCDAIVLPCDAIAT